MNLQLFLEETLCLCLFIIRNYIGMTMTILCAVPVATCNLIGPKWAGRIGAPAHA